MGQEPADVTEVSTGVRPGAHWLNQRYSVRDMRKSRNLVRDLRKSNSTSAG